jgi:hypothetical protein
MKDHNGMAFRFFSNRNCAAQSFVAMWYVDGPVGVVEE